MTIHIPRRNQGQIIEVGYGWHLGDDSADLYRRVYDRSALTIEWWRASDKEEVVAYAETSSELWEEPPPMTEWEPCADPTEDDGPDEA